MLFIADNATGSTTTVCLQLIILAVCPETMFKRLFIPMITWMGRRIERRRFTAPPVYIGGCGRSGTTLLLSVLSAHPEIFACPRELNLFEGARASDRELAVPKRYRLYRTFITEKIKPTANRYCEKSPSNIRHVAWIDRLHAGEFRMIQIIRDGRDVILSSHPRDPGHFWVSPERWISDVQTGLQYLQHPNVHTIRYEDLVGDFDTTVRGICNFLGIAFSEEIRNWHDHTTVQKNKALFSNIQKITQAPVGKWKEPGFQDRVSQLTRKPEALDLLKKLKYI
jgi:hypothetical protein